MTDEEEKKLNQTAIKIWGTEGQLDMVVEECAELIDAIQKYRRGRVGLRQVSGEMGDVQNCINQFKNILPDFESQRQEKLSRLKALIDKPFEVK